MLDVRGFEPDDLMQLNLQPMQEVEMYGIPNWREMALQCANVGPSWTARHDGRIVGCAGMALFWPGRAQVWAFIADGIPRPVWTAIHRAVELRLAQAPALGIRRLEANTLVGFEQAKRWVRMLGFRPDGCAEAYGPDGADFDRWVRLYRRAAA